MLSIDLTGKTAIVTGASQGLGTETARQLHAAGANVGIGYLDDEDEEQHDESLERMVTRSNLAREKLLANIVDKP